MANYRKRQSYKPYKSRSFAHESNAWVWLLTGMFVGILGAAILYMLIMGNSTAKKLKQNTQNTPSTATQQASTSTSPLSKKKESSQKFEFYNILPGMEVPTAKTSNSKSSSSKATPTKNSLSAAQYLVQVGMFRKLNQADELKANLALQGFYPSIQRINAADGAWFRVTIGPFGSESLALAQKNGLEKQKIHATLVLQQP